MTPRGLWGRGRTPGRAPSPRRSRGLSGGRGAGWREAPPGPRDRAGGVGPGRSGRPKETKATPSTRLRSCSLPRPRLEATWVPASPEPGLLGGRAPRPRARPLGSSRFSWPRDPPPEPPGTPPGRRALCAALTAGLPPDAVHVGDPGGVGAAGAHGRAAPGPASTPSASQARPPGGPWAEGHSPGGEPGS